MNITTISSMKKIEVFGPNTSKIKLDKDDKYANIAQKWQGNKKNRVQIIVGQQDIPTECLDWAMIISMIAAKIITVGKTVVDKKPAAKKKAAAKKVKVEAKAAATLAEEVEDGLPPA